MKKTYFLLVSAILLNVSWCIGQEVLSQQKMLVTKVTATWCPTCGGNAWDVKNNIVANYEEDAIFLASHISRSSRLHSTTAEEYTENLPSVFGQPLYYINTTKYNTSSIESAISDRSAQIRNQTPVANTGIAMQLNGNTLDVKAKVQFFQPANGAYYLSLYIVEDKIIENQAGRGNNVEHSKVLRDRMTEATFGELLHDGEITNNQTFEFRLEKEINPEWISDNIEIVGVIWRKDGSNYEYVNATAEREFSTFTSLNLLEKKGVQLSVSPTTLNTQATISLELPTSEDHLSLQLINATGQVVNHLLSSAVLAEGIHNYTIDKGNLASGVYFVQLEQLGNAITKRIVVR